jgi:hypothetical protein
MQVYEQRPQPEDLDDTCPGEALLCSLLAKPMHMSSAAA